MYLFDQISREDKDPAEHSESSFHYLNRTARLLFVQVREFLEDWFSRYPDADKEELRARFRASDDAQHYGAFFELLLYQLFHNLGADVEIHPAMPSTSRRPDFLVRPAEGQAFILEATVVTFQSADDVAGEARLTQVYDILDRKVDSTNYFISVEVSGSPSTPPPANKIVKLINDKLRDLNIEEISVLYQNGGYERVPVWSFNYNDWSILFRPIPKSPKARGRAGVRPLGTFLSGVKLIDRATSLRDAVFTKAKAYGEIPYPFVVAIDALEPLEDYDIEAAFLGRERFTIPITKVGAPNPVVIVSREPNGVWAPRKGSSSKRVSAVLVASGLRPWSLGETRFAGFHNPLATIPLTLAVSKIRQYAKHEDHFMMIDEGKQLPELLGVSWPLKEAG